MKPLLAEYVTACEVSKSAVHNQLCIVILVCFFVFSAIGMRIVSHALCVMCRFKCVRTLTHSLTRVLIYEQHIPQGRPFFEVEGEPLCGALSCRW